MASRLHDVPATSQSQIETRRWCRFLLSHALATMNSFGPKWPSLEAGVHLKEGMTERPNRVE